MAEQSHADFASLVEDEPIPSTWLSRFKCAVIDAHCHGWLPAWAVTFTFWLAPGLRKS